MMGKHAEHGMHPNSLLAYSEEEDAGHLSRRASEILAVYVRLMRPLTDRDVKNELGFEDMNFVRPRITELIYAGRLQEVGSATDPITGKACRLVGLMQSCDPQSDLLEEIDVTEDDRGGS